ncbi:MAG: hypothetical protein KGZ80_09900 [Methylomonas sp.]|nr:hypothetical protein [Methylomonas sp.]PPD20868.1 MAG: hypothetical protein CTY23_07235 [Methylomonas sp.]PPD26343.1 MAG: hypothetical protein CTY22_05515 [Methylomonas sp.]PPD38064.1 MAG: hypothetical protein CTY21_05510 [Methylomonas sp.]PPD40299.1 MAG: hypothetical protein CTY17_06725 [Methylomonas sp.]
MKACDSCSDRVHIGCNHRKMSVLSRAIGLVLIYLPILTLPFIFTSAYLVYFSLKFCGAENVKRYSDFIPDRASHRYDLKSQIVMNPATRINLSQTKLFWILNCTWYCPYSVALFEWHAYMVKVVENWWCPFGHERKNDYGDGAIDQSFWHIYPDEKAKLNDEDRNNPIFTENPDA